MKKVHPVGIEPMTNGLTALRSITEPPYLLSDVAKKSKVEFGEFSMHRAFHEGWITG